MTKSGTESPKWSNYVWIVFAFVIIALYFFGLTIPLVGPDWRIARTLSHLLGAPIPDHVSETLHRGRLADNRLMRSLLGVQPDTSTTEVIDRLYHWPSVIRQPARVQVA